MFCIAATSPGDFFSMVLSNSTIASLFPANLRGSRISEGIWFLTDPTKFLVHTSAARSPSCTSLSSTSSIGGDIAFALLGGGGVFFDKLLRGVGGGGARWAAAGGSVVFSGFFQS